jgi:hypothetical protein
LDVESGDEEENDDDDDTELPDGRELCSFAIDEIPQAFSHFTFRYTKRKLLVCDLQGVLTETPRPMFEFTDPVIHYRSGTGRSSVFGRTDLGHRDIHAFLHTHTCGELCRTLTKRWVRRPREEAAAQ